MNPAGEDSNDWWEHRDPINKTLHLHQPSLFLSVSTSLPPSSLGLSHTHQSIKESSLSSHIHISRFPHSAHLFISPLLRHGRRPFYSSRSLSCGWKKTKKKKVSTENATRVGNSPRLVSRIWLEGNRHRSYRCKPKLASPHCCGLMYSFTIWNSNRVMNRHHISHMQTGFRNTLRLTKGLFYVENVLGQKLRNTFCSVITHRKYWKYSCSVWDWQIGFRTINWASLPFANLKSLLKTLDGTGMLMKAAIKKSTMSFIFPFFSVLLSIFFSILPPTHIVTIKVTICKRKFMICLSSTVSLH